MTAIANYIDLRLAVSDLVGNRNITDVFPMLVQMAESDFNSRLRTRQQIVEATMTFEEGISPLPPDFMELISIRNGQGCEIHPRYEVDGFNMRIRDYEGDLDIQYYCKLPSLTTSATATNWMLVKYPAVYLYGVGLQAAKFLKDVDMAQAVDQLYGSALGSLDRDDYRARWANQVVRVQGATP